MEFIYECVERNEYPKHYRKSVQRCHIKPNTKSLKRHALNILYGAKENMREMERISIQYHLASDQLCEPERAMLKDYVQSVCKSASERKELSC